MNKKILIFTLCFTMIFSSLNIKKSYASPQTIIVAGIISHLGSLAFKTLDVVLTGKDVIEVGNYVYSKLTLSQQNNLLDSYNTDISKFEKLSHEYMQTLPKQEYNYHFTSGVVKPLVLGDVREGVHNEVISESNGLYKYNTYRQLYGSYYRILVFTPSDIFAIDSCKNIQCSIEDPNVQNAFYMYDHKGTFNIGCKHGDEFRIKRDYSTYNLDVSSYNCSNCPHEFDFPKTPYSKFEGISEEQKDYIKENYPNYNIDSLPPNYNGSNNGGNNDSNNGGNNGSNNGGNNPIITNPPSFPNLEEFNFNGLELDSLTNLFSNFKTKFPFSLPFDLVNLIGSLSVDPIPPRFETEIFNYNFVLDFTQFEVLAQLVRGFTLLFYIVSLIFITKRFGG